MKNGVVSTFYEHKVYQNNGLQELLLFFRRSDHIVLDIGCGNGANARILQEQGRKVYGVTMSSAEAELVRQFMQNVTVGNIEEIKLPYSKGMFDAILLSHVLEHLVNPWETLRNLKSLLRDNGRVYAAVPNALSYRQRLQFLLGKFEYQDNGVMDIGHLRFFTFKTAQKLFTNSGYKIITAKVNGSIPLWPIRKVIGYPSYLDNLAGRLLPGLTGGNIFIAAEVDNSYKSE